VSDRGMEHQTVTFGVPWAASSFSGQALVYLIGLGCQVVLQSYF